MLAGDPSTNSETIIKFILCKKQQVLLSHKILNSEYEINLIILRSVTDKSINVYLITRN